MSDEESNRSEAATPHKLKEAKQRGQVSKSPDLISVMVLTVVVAYLYWQGWEIVREQFRFAESIFHFAGRTDINPPLAMQLVAHVLKTGLVIMAPFFIAVMLSAIVANLMQTGVVLSADPIKPDFNRINPMTGFKRFFSVRTLFDLLRVCCKLLLLIFVGYEVLKGLLPEFFNLSALTPQGYVRTLINDVASLGFKLVLMLGLIALVDVIYTRREFAKKMTMSRRDLREESKQLDGHPRIRSRLRELRREILKRSAAVNNAKNADVVITNPTHVAVALCYRHGEMASPQLVAKGAGVLAAAIRHIAARHGIPVVQNRALARKLFRQVDFDQHIPTSLFAEVAPIIIWVLAMRKSQAAARRGVSEGAA